LRGLILIELADANESVKGRFLANGSSGTSD
jgi:hypothetical protein